MIRSCSKCVTFLFIFYVFFFAFVNHQSSAYCSFFNLCYLSFSRSHWSSKHKQLISICYIPSPSVKNCSIHAGLYILITLSSTILKGVIYSALYYLKPLSMPNALVSSLGIFIFPFESCNVIVISSLISLGSQIYLKIRIILDIHRRIKYVKCLHPLNY